MQNRINEIEVAVATGAMSASQCFTQMRQLLPPNTATSAHVPDGWQIVPKEPTPEIMAAAAIAAWPQASASDVAMAKKAAWIVIQSMHAEPGITLDMLAATLATMAPAYRAMLAAAPQLKGEAA
jgi:hypothetical protein